MQLLFVYGTLKKSFGRNYILHSQRYLGTAFTEPIYGMYAYRGYPALVDHDLAEKSKIKANSQIYGEIYEVDFACLNEVDKIEGVDRGVFERRAIALDTITLMVLPLSKNVWDNVSKKTAQAYFFKDILTGAADCGSLWTQK